MRHKIKKIVLIVAYFCLTIAHASSASDELVQLLNSMQSMQATFMQSTTNPKGKMLNQTTGSMALERPKKFRWNTLQPNAQLIVTNGQKIWIYDVDLEQVTIRNLNKEDSEIPALLLTNIGTLLTRDFTVQAIKNRSSLRWFLLTPKNSRNMFESIQLGFDHQSIKQMQLRDHLGQITTIYFKQVVINSSLSSALFTFKTPPHVDVIDETK